VPIERPCILQPRFLRASLLRIKPDKPDKCILSYRLYWAIACRVAQKTRPKTRHIGAENPTNPHMTVSLLRILTILRTDQRSAPPLRIGGIYVRSPNLLPGSVSWAGRRGRQRPRVPSEHWHPRCNYSGMSTKSKDSCEHPGCTCPQAKDSKYCSAFCEGQASHPSIECECGHTTCAATKSAGGSSVTV
jgi:hypothetical protein